MVIKSPKFWDQPNSRLAALLEPLSWLYRAGAILHHKMSCPYRAGIPVISVGNIVLGGAGKTPVTLALARILQTMGRTPHVISQGYGGSLIGPIQVDPARHTYQEVGDEPLLLAQMLPTWVSKNRRAAADLAHQSGADILLLDDAHQNHTLEKDMNFLVVNTSQGFGNGRVFPAGPLRQTLRAGLKNTTALILIGEDGDPLPDQLCKIPCPLIRAKIVPVDPTPCPVVGFAGLGHPEKFRQTLLKAGYLVKAFIPFADHYPYQEGDLTNLKKQAQEAQACLITTEKDYVRIPEPSRQGILTLAVRLKFWEEKTIEKMLQSFLKSTDTPVV